MADRLTKRLEEILEGPGHSACGIISLAELKDPPSHELLREAILGLKGMEHRGGTLDDTGDGAGLLVKTERSFFERFIAPGRRLQSEKEPLIVGNAFFLHGERNVPQLRREVDVILLREGLMPLGWREVPTNPSILGSRAREDAPIIYQILAGKGHRREAQLEEALHQVKILIEKTLPGIINVVSLEPYTTVYKALSTADQLANYYPDFDDPDFVTSLVIGHRRFSTNTFSNWNLVQPFRHIAHNGEINTIKANYHAINDANCALNLTNTLMNHGSDSAQVDRVAEMMAATGMRDIHEALRRMITPAWNEDSPSKRESQFFEANRRALGTLGAWEGPIAIVATDGNMLTAILDRMGLRPLRYMKTTSGRVIISSEIGAVPVNPVEIELDGQLEPGGMLIADLNEGRLIPQEFTNEWIIDRTELDFKNLSTVDILPVGSGRQSEPLSTKVLNSFGWTSERVNNVHEMAKAKKEPIYGMGNDRPLAIFSENPSRIYSFLHQIVAVVTNPPIDPIREGGAIDTTIYLGRSPQLTKKSAYKSWPQYELPHPILNNKQMASILTTDALHLKTYELDATFEDNGKSRTMVRRIHDLTNEAIEVIRSGAASILVVSDYAATKGKRLPLPILFVISSIHRGLAEKGLRRDASIIAETAGTHEAHDCAILLAYGATAINPYAMLHIAREIDGMDLDVAEENVTRGIVSALKKVMAKMGITNLAGYRGSALFEAIGISSEVVEYYIPDTVSRLGGITIDDIYSDTVIRFSIDEDQLAHNKNITTYRREVTDALQLVARNGNANKDYDHFINLLADTPPVYLRDMLSFRDNSTEVNPNSVANTEEIIRTTIRAAGMSHGAINSTAHRAIAAAFNHFDSMANSGEGGEDERRNAHGEWKSDRSRTRQIASGRFGVDATYLINADEIEIKIGQGAKPGEGGHLPGWKVTAEIAGIRKTKTGIDLISPPPHHDIYSIEDLAQLIVNLRELNSDAKIAVKVPSITGLGTIGVGIAKAGADTIVVSGYTGGTGAASLGSILHAGLPLERGISETHQYLKANGIRSMVRLRADGGIKSGMGMAKIMALGADEIAIGTPLLIAECCIFCRGCSKGKCPVGIATQDEGITRSRFMRRYVDGSAPAEQGDLNRYQEAKAGVIRYLECLANDFRNILAGLGLNNPNELTGRVDLLERRPSGNERWDKLDLTELVSDLKQYPEVKRNDDATSVSKKNKYILQKAQDALSGPSQRIDIDLELTNSDHAIGSTLAGEIARCDNPLDSKQIRINCKGYAGHGFGFGATSGMNLRLEGYANDAAAEIMSGTARIVIVSPYPTQNIPHLIGNAAAYGATGGTLYVAGTAGQRFGVRNSGATLVCEGAGKYAFEYMTGGIGVVLGKCGPVIGSGMTGGELFIYDPDNASKSKLHAAVTSDKISPGTETEETLKTILGDYFETTKSSRIAAILKNWDQTLPHFIHVRSI